MYRALNSPELNNKITNFNDQQFCTDEKSFNLAVQKVNNIFYKAAKKAGLRKKKGVSIKKQNNEKWFDTECKRIWKEFRNLSNQKHRHPRNTDLQYFTSLKRYKEIIKRKKQHYNSKLLHEIKESINKNEFWSMWKNLSIKETKEIPIQNGNIWTEHFKKVNSEIKFIDTNQNQIKEKLQNFGVKFKDNQNPLDFPISSEELS